MRKEEKEEEWAQGQLSLSFGRTCFRKGEVVYTEKTRRPPEDD